MLLALGVWVCIQGLCYRHVSMFYWVHDLPCVWLPLSMSACDMWFHCVHGMLHVLVLWCVSVCLRPNILVHAVYADTKPCWCAMAHLTRDFVGFCWGSRCLCHDALDPKCRWISATKIKWNFAKFSSWNSTTVIPIY